MNAVSCTWRGAQVWAGFAVLDWKQTLGGLEPEPRITEQGGGDSRSLSNGPYAIGYQVLRTALYKLDARLTLSCRLVLIAKTICGGRRSQACLLLTSSSLGSQFANSNKPESADGRKLRWTFKLTP
ncbi:unnamed protein product [Protopolystoma xenopodis]|uniref:Uncharacterized protein n=1 Tax=Protopolystoma xenopodis TaxID=117903 RepID=A0A3S5CNA7_9PLAT|nr:unnamed protein product [Protopolystoma xenopodis]